MHTATRRLPLGVTSRRGERCGRLERSSSALNSQPLSSQRCHQRCSVAGETLKAAPGRLQRTPLLDSAHQREPTSQSELGISVQIHPSPPLSVSPARPTASKEGRIEPQPFTTSVGTTTSYPATMERVMPVAVLLSVAGKAEKPAPPVMPRSTPFGRVFLKRKRELVPTTAIAGGLVPARRSTK